ncbi:MAG: lipopolysaccharide heptosyltransferase family protein [Candidatus Thiodubiliella endoseptemdiera]|uniref:Lipopolysaccharide heptosyltransferase family protein n=1 Tax=Candidatus Thiodubiliella endoseptemdiera TaxID=2738886 RepID=A0A853F4L7_9GAMM|nr:lipopolysaccharide heptosyltransferase family protein [Candidatus Thiodubiliella endoseptemdiera]
MLRFYRTYTTPFKEKIPTFVEVFFLRVPLFKRFLRFFGRYIYSEITLRDSQKLNTITKQHKKILWVQWVDSYLGDSLMDLSSRILLKDKEIDLLTKENVANIYQNDTIFRHIFTDPKQCASNQYDLLIIDSYRQRSLKVLTKDLLQLPHISLYGYYNVDDFNRLYFSFFHINKLTGCHYNQQQIEQIAKPLLPISKQDKITISSLNLPNNFIAIVIGSASVDRNFNKWDVIVDAIFTQDIVENIVLIGAKNAKIEARKIQRKHPNKIIDTTGRCSFNQTAQIIKKSNLLVCADGGLLHAANAVLTPVVALFYHIEPTTRLIKINKSIALMGKNNMGHIQSDTIIEKIQLLQKDSEWEMKQEKPIN